MGNLGIDIHTIPYLSRIIELPYNYQTKSLGSDHFHAQDFVTLELVTKKGMS